MARALSRRERNVIVGGGIFLVCFLTYWIVLSPKREELGVLKARVSGMAKEYEEIKRIEADYMRLKRETDPVMNKILRRGKEFDLAAFVAETEKVQNFSRERQVTLRDKAYGNFEKRSSIFSYKDKTLEQIVEFLKEIEKPENVVAIESLTIKPKSASDPSRLSLEVKLATVVPVR